MREKCLNEESLWSIISCIWNEYEELLCKSSHTVQIRDERNRKKIMRAPFTQFWHTLVLRLGISKLGTLFFISYTVMTYFSVWVFFHEYSRFTGQQVKGEAISLKALYHFYPLHRHLDISRLITAESSPLHIARNWTQPGNFGGFQATHPKVESKCSRVNLPSFLQD